MLKFEAKKGDFAKICKKWGGGYSPPVPPAPPPMAILNFCSVLSSDSLLKISKRLSVRPVIVSVRLFPWLLTTSFLKIDSLMTPIASHTLLDS